MPDSNEKLTRWSHLRQLLGKQAKNPEQALSSIIGVYSAHPSAPLSLFARVQNFSEKAFFELDEKRLAYRVPAMRQSVYLLPKDFAHIAMAATLDAPDDPSWEKRYSQPGRKIPPEYYENWTAEVLKVATKPLNLNDIAAATSIPHDNLKTSLNRMAFERKLLRVGAKSLRSNGISYVATESWNGTPFEHIDQAKAQIRLAEKYLRAFGPARVKDFQWWAGITATQAKTAFGALETANLGEGLLLLKTDLAAYEAFKIPQNDCLDILPQWDSYIMGYAPDGRERFVSPDMQHHIYGKLGATGGNGLGTVLLNGKAIGSWTSRFKGSNMEVSLNLFDTTGEKLKNDLTEAFKNIAGLLDAKKVVFENKP